MTLRVVLAVSRNVTFAHLKFDGLAYSQHTLDGDLIKGQKGMWMNVYVGGAIWVIGVAALAAAGTILFHRFRLSGARSGSDAVATVFGLVGGLHAVVMAFVLISLFDTVSTVKGGAQSEANGLVAVYWASDSLPEPAKIQIQELSRTYARTVIDQEWPSMRDGDPVTGSGWSLLDRIRAAIDAAQVDSDWQTERKTEAASQLWSVYEARQARLNAAGDSGVSAVVWIALIAGSVLSISLPYLFDSPNLIAHAMLMFALAGTIALMLFAIYQLQNPFSGGAQVGPDAFNSVIERFGARAS
jgi:vacuolar-type H+-ATPase subunit I/STV1